MRKINMIIIHTAYTTPNMDIGVTEIEAWHKARGFSEIGYHFVIRRDGSVETGRRVQKIGAHVKGFNRTSIGICMAGGKARNGDAVNNYTLSQWLSVTRLINGLAVIYEIQASQILGHRDLPGVRKECPCFDVRAWLKQEKQIGGVFNEES